MPPSAAPRPGAAGARSPWARRLALAAMALVTAWSLWAWGQPKKGPAVVAPTPAEERSAASNEAREQRAEERRDSGEPGPMNWTEFGRETPPFIAMLVNFGILVGGYYLLGKKPIAAGLQARRETIARDIEEAARMRREAEERAKVYQAKLERLEDEVRTAREALVRAGEAERDRIVADAEAKAERMRKDAEFLVDQELKQMRLDVWREAVEAAVVAAEELLHKRVTPADQERLAEDFLADLGGKARATGVHESHAAEPEAENAS